MHYKFKETINFSFKFIVTLFVGYILIFFSKSRGISILFLVTVVYYLWNIVDRIYLRIFLKFFSGLVPVLIFIIFYYEFTLPFDFRGDSEATRIYMVYSSIKIFMENPVLGIGLGNWTLEAFKYGVSDIKGFNHPIIYYRFGNHNLYTQFLSEIGMMGLISFVLPIFIILRSKLKIYKNLDSFQQANFVAIILYLLSACIYRDVNSYESHFSLIQFLSFCSLGILVKDTKSYITTDLNRLIIILLFLVSAVCLFWWGYEERNRLLYQKVLLNTKSQKSKELLKSLYNPSFKSTHGFYGDNSGKNKSILLELAKSFLLDKEYANAERCFRLSLDTDPYNEFLLLAYSRFLLRIKNDLSAAKKYASRVYSIQNNHYEVNLLMAEIAMMEGEYTDAKTYLNKIKFNISYYDKVWFLELYLYNSEYIDNLVGLTSQQKFSLIKDRQKINDNWKNISTRIIELDESNAFALKKEIRGYINIQKRILFKVLSKKQFIIYLRDNSMMPYKYRIEKMERHFTLSSRQKQLLFDLIVSIELEKEYLQLEKKMIQPSKTNAILKIDKALTKLSNQLDKGLLKILTDKQYEIFINKKVF